MTIYTLHFDLEDCEPLDVNALADRLFEVIALAPELQGVFGQLHENTCAEEVHCVYMDAIPVHTCDRCDATFSGSTRQAIHAGWFSNINPYTGETEFLCPKHRHPFEKEQA